MSAKTRREIEVWPAKKERPAYFRRLVTNRQKRTFTYSEGSFNGGEKSDGIFWTELDVKVGRFHGPGTLTFRISRPAVIKSVESLDLCGCGKAIRSVKKQKVRESTCEHLMLYPHEARMLLDFLLETFE